MEYPGLLNWANSIRQTMASDPGRQLFKDQVQIHGFSFLDDYLDNIISGRKQDPLIELVKTPGRKKAAALKKPDEVLPINIPTAPVSQLLYDRDRVLADIQEEDVEMPVKPIDKPIPPSFPTLPEPIPLRKSTKPPPRDPSINTVLLGAATPGAPVGGMRTSWLMKAREANVDRLSKKSAVGTEVGASLTFFQGTKRKSDPFSLPQVGIRDDERPPKLAKTSEGETEISQSRPPVIVEQPPVVVESAPEGVFDRLKKVVEDLGIRVERDRKVEERKQPEVMKVLQMAAVAAKKQQEEADKKAARLKEMESRRQLAIQRKAEEEKAKVLEEERKMKEEAERRKKEREPIKYTVKKKDDENLKKRKIEMEKKQEIKKPSASILINKTHYPPSMLGQSQKTARVKVQIDAPKPVTTTKHAVPSEDIELPEINSEYSDSEDEDRVRTFNPPEWAQSPELRQALEMQSTMNPDDIFGAVRPLRMEEIFKSRTSRFRARTSSANWTGTDRLTMQEQGEYARRMGFK